MKAAQVNRSVQDALIYLFSVLDTPFDRDKLYEQQYYRYFNILQAVCSCRNIKRILEIGPGVGHLSICLKWLGFDIVCVDFNTCITKERFNKHNIPIVQHDIEFEDLPFMEGQFDLVLLTDVLEHFTNNPDKSLKRIKRVIANGGALIITTPNVLYFPLILYPLFGKNVFPIISEYYIQPIETKLRQVYDRHNRFFTIP